MPNSQNVSESPSEKSEDKLTFEKLTPAHLNDEEMQGYTEALDFVFQEDDLLNIAITGPHASGKSSVIKTYEENLEKNKKQLNGIHISLSYFSPTLESKIKGKKSVNEAFEDELMLERKIINQLIHQIDPDKIPATEFKVKSEAKKWTKIIWTGIISLIVFCLIYIKEIWFTKLLNEHPVITLILIAFSFIFIAFVTYKVIELQNGKHLIRKLKIFENEIDISTSSCDVSYFDKYLNEIIYILDESKLDYIVFEDIDRYNDNLILNKLRELNYTYNKKQIKNKPKQIKFLYLIKDEIFESKERTKFFDYILPIVPVMDNSNSLGKMEEIFKSQNISSDFSLSFLDTLSLYLDDIRLIKNICNEYIVYKKKLAHDANWFKRENLLAIIVYKNIFPADFSLTRLGLGQGVVHRIINSLLKQKSELHKTKIEEINNKIKARKETLNTIETSHLRNIEELDALYINFRNEINFNEYKFIGKTDISSLNQKQFINALKLNNWVLANYSIDEKNSYYYKEINLKKYYEDLEKNPEYQERKKDVEIVIKNKKITLAAETRILEKEKFQLKLPKKITEIIKLNQNNGVTIENLFQKHIGELGLENTKENEILKKYQAEYQKLSSSCYFPLLRVLIIQGYIDEYYSDYTSFFDEQGLPKNDTLFLRNISERINTEWNLKLEKPELVLKKLNTDKSNFSENYILNDSLLDYILANDENNYLSLLISSFTSRTETDFEDKYLARYYSLLANKETHYHPKCLCFFIKQLNIKISNIWQYIDMFDIRLYLYLSFIHNQEIVLDKMNEDNKLKEFIDDSSDFLLIDDEWNTIFNLLDEQQHNLDKIVNSFIKLDIKFKQLGNSVPQLLELVEKNNNYQLNQFNVKYILENKYKQSNFDAHIIQTVLSCNDDVPIKSYFQSNPEELVLSIAQSEIATIDDNEETVLFILNHEDISSSAKIAYIDKLSIAIGLYNVKNILKNKYHLTDFDSHISQTVLGLTDDASIKLYFQRTPEKLVLSITQSEIETIDDNEETVLFVLNHDKISSSAKIAYIDKLTTIIDELNQITDKDVWDALIEKQRVQYSAENIVHYFFNYELKEKNENRIINEKLANFINQNDKNIPSEEAKIRDLITKDNEISLFFTRITINVNLENAKYDMLISWFTGRYYYNFNFQDIAEKKISILIKHRVINLNNREDKDEEQDLNFIRKNYPNNILELIIHNVEGYINKLTDDESLVDHDEIIRLLSTDLSLEQKISLLKLTSEPISINHVDYPTGIQEYILENNFDFDDLAYITSEQFYNSTTNEIKAIINPLCVENKTQILKFEQISYDLLIVLLNLEDFSLDDKYILLCNQINHLDAKQTYDAFKIIEKEDSVNENYFSDLFISKLPCFEVTDLNQKIIEELNKKFEINFTIVDNQINANGHKLLNG